ncbi:hypothetical protein EVAR_99557_1 [Eumeta japonica]|uniref:Uncharacterized protein n=1 Tax=Eumeta variegata TaxID=151549 RepID=A0A4C1YWX8_EUMVA|nr:hypothetical protein EVAR_99557_1 [Eumeta japonica]
MKKEADILSISCKFISPVASNMGGAYKCLVRSVKTTLTGTLRVKSPRKKVLHILFLEAEHIVNSRPSTEVNTEADLIGYSVVFYINEAEKVTCKIRPKLITDLDGYSLCRRIALMRPL